jgi:DNA processing protein
MPLNPIDLLRLHTTPGIGARTLHRILTWTEGDPERLATLFTLDAATLRKQFKLSDAALALGAGDGSGAREAFDAVEAAGFSVITMFDPVYPASVRARLGDKLPPILYIKGARGLLTQPGVAVSGSRHASEIGMNHTAELVRDAVAQGYAIISGHAPGVDMVAHQTALESGGSTVLVIPEGALRFTPRAELRPLMESRAENVLIISEFPPNMPWSAQNAMIRNGTIIGLAQALLIIEAGDTGGTLNAGQQALKLGVPTYALQYDPMPPSAPGNAMLIDQGATPISTSPRLVPPDYTGKREPPQPKQDKPKQLSLF